jgi:hypothetical protein
MNGPLSSLRDTEVAAIFVIAVGATVSWGTLFPPLRPIIVRLELAPTTIHVQEVIGAWESAGLVDDAKRSVLIDLVWIVCYTSMLATVGELAARAADAGEMASAIRSVTAVLVYLAVAAGVLDYVENAGLWFLLAGNHAQPVPALTTVASGLKWLAVFVVAAVALPTLVFHCGSTLRDWVADH